MPVSHDFRHVVMARTLALRMRGVIGRGPSFRLFIPRCRSIHTCFLRAPIDAVYLDRDCRVVAVHTGIRPWRVSFGPRSAVGVLELPAGGAASIAVGDLVAIPE